MGRKYFGTDGVRGPVGGAMINAEFVRRLAWAVGAYLRAELKDKPVQAVVGRDTRESGKALTDAIVSGFAAHDIKVFDVEMAPTPAVALAVRELQADVGVVITASHNPATDNGIKFFNGKGFKLTDTAEQQIEAYIDEAPAADPSQAKPRVSVHDASRAYRKAMRACLAAHDLHGWKIAVDTANGATFRTTPDTLRELGAEVVAIGAEPDGCNINDGVGSENPGALARLVRESGARIGIAHDGDGDRVVLIDETGSILDGDEVMAMLALDKLDREMLPGNTLVATVMSNLGLDKALERAGGKVERVAVGDRYVIERMREKDYTLGGESSGHFICGDCSTTGDGLLAAMQVLELMLRTGNVLSELRKVMHLFPQEKKNLPVAKKPPLDEVPGFWDDVRTVEKSLNPGRVLVRYSGTEPKIRLLVEAEDPEVAKNALHRLEDIVNNRISA